MSWVICLIESSRSTFIVDCKRRINNEWTLFFPSFIPSSHISSFFPRVFPLITIPFLLNHLTISSLYPEEKMSHPPHSPFVTGGYHNYSLYPPSFLHFSPSFSQKSDHPRRRDHVDSRECRRREWTREYGNGRGRKGGWMREYSVDCNMKPALLMWVRWSFFIDWW